MTIVLFSDIHRVDTSVPRYAESRFSYLDQSARPAFERMRQLLDHWWREFPLAEQDELRSRLQTDDDHQFLAAVFELYVYQILLRTNHQVTIHRPEAAGGCPKRPDFCATSPDGTQVVLEAILATEASDAHRGADGRTNQLLDAINELDCPDFYLSLDREGEPKTPIPSRKWLHELRQWIASLDYDEIVRLGRQQAFGDLPSLALDHDGLRVTFRPIPKKREYRGRLDAQPIGAESFEGVLIESWKAIRRAIRRKASRYGDPAVPYLIAVNGVGAYCDYDQFERALYGADGLWNGHSPPKHTRVSGILAISQLVPSTICRVSPCLFHNPFAALPYTGSLCPLPQVRWTNGGVQFTPGIIVSELFGLPQGWPYLENDS